MRTYFTAIGLLVWIFAAGSSAAQTATQFDLKCEGRRQATIEGEWEPYAYGFRIDLGAGMWCWDHCERTYQIARSTPSEIVLLDERTDDRRRRSWSENRINRQNGSHELWSAETFPLVRSYKVEGTCRPAAFSGFPTGLF